MRVTSRREFLTRIAFGLPIAWLGCRTADEASDGGATPPQGKPATIASDGGVRDAPGVSDARDAAMADEPAVVDDSLDALARTLQGSVVTPNDAAYDDARGLFNPRFDAIHPAVVVQCKSATDVQRAIAWARRHDMPITARSGGHSYAGYSIGVGMVLDLRAMASIQVDQVANTVVVGPGAVLLDVYAAVWDKFAFAAGSCPSVGITGHALGGGFGYVARKFGEACDNLLAIEIVTAAGDILTCTATENADLFWACRGGGGGTFGVVTQLTFAIHPIDAVSYAFVYFDWSDAAAVVDAWQKWAPTAPDELTSVCQLFASADDSPYFSIGAQYLGSSDELAALMQPILDAATPTDQTFVDDTYENVVMMWAGCNGTITQCHLATKDPQGTITRERFRARSDYVATPLGSDGIQKVIDWVQARHDRGLPFGGIMFDAYGGAIDRVPVDATAFAHRDQLFSCQYIADDTDDPADADNIAWLQGFWSDMRPFVSGAAYQNYIDADLVDWEAAYYGANYPRLRQIKAKYDPDNVFRFAQSIKA